MSSPIQKACLIVGGQSAFAKRLSEITGKVVTQQRVQKWLARDALIPPEFASAAEQATNFLITRKHLRPDDWASIWPELVPVKINRKYPDNQQLRDSTGSIGMRLKPRVSRITK